MKKVIVGFSGGIDSTATALILREAGYTVQLLTLQTTDDIGLLDRACRRAEQLDLPWESLDVRERFRHEVIDYFIESYRRGETPSPCAVCNARIKWPLLYDAMRQKGYDYIATGHYVRIESVGERYYVQQGVDPNKDQSYYLWDLPQKYLQSALTPLGSFCKSEILRRYGQSDTPRESMSICFLSGLSCAEYLQRHLPVNPGEIIDETGQVIGRHAGYALYTIGQKKGLQLDREGMVVTGIDPLHNRLRVGPPHTLRHHHLILHSYRISDPTRLQPSASFRVRIRGIGQNPGGQAHLIDQTADTLHLYLEEPALAASPGQPVVLYDQDRVLGGGFLKSYF